MDLPIELYMNIFTYLDYQDLLKVFRTCKTWRELLFQKYFWTTKIYLDFGEILELEGSGDQYIYYYIRCAVKRGKFYPGAEIFISPLEVLLSITSKGAWFDRVFERVIKFPISPFIGSSEIVKLFSMFNTKQKLMFIRWSGKLEPYQISLLYNNLKPGEIWTINLFLKRWSKKFGPLLRRKFIGLVRRARLSNITIPVRSSRIPHSDTDLFKNMCKTKYFSGLGFVKLFRLLLEKLLKDFRAIREILDTGIKFDSVKYIFEYFIAKYNGINPEGFLEFQDFIRK